MQRHTHPAAQCHCSSHGRRRHPDPTKACTNHTSPSAANQQQTQTTTCHSSRNHGRLASIRAIQASQVQPAVLLVPQPEWRRRFRLQALSEEDEGARKITLAPASSSPGGPASEDQAGFPGMADIQSTGRLFSYCCSVWESS